MRGTQTLIRIPGLKNGSKKVVQQNFDSWNLRNDQKCFYLFYLNVVVLGFFFQKSKYKIVATLVYYTKMRSKTNMKYLK